MMISNPKDYMTPAKRRKLLWGIAIAIIPGGSVLALSMYTYNKLKARKNKKKGKKHV